jgi:hypothetical protein
VLGKKQCCGTGSGIRYFLDLWIRDRGWETNPDPDLGSEMSIPDDFSESLETVFGLKILKFFKKGVAKI